MSEIIVSPWLDVAEFVEDERLTLVCAHQIVEQEEELRLAARFASVWNETHKGPGRLVLVPKDTKDVQ